MNTRAPELILQPDIGSWGFGGGPSRRSDVAAATIVTSSGLLPLAQSPLNPGESERGAVGRQRQHNEQQSAYFRDGPSGKRTACTEDHPCRVCVGPPFFPESDEGTDTRSTCEVGASGPSTTMADSTSISLTRRVSANARRCRSRCPITSAISPCRGGRGCISPFPPSNGGGPRSNFSRYQFRSRTSMDAR